MSENRIDYLNIKTPDNEAYADCWVVEDTAGASAQCYIFGPRRGDEIFELVQNSLQEAANKNSLPIRHVYTSSNKGSLALIERSSGYLETGKDKLGNDTFEKIYSPQSPKGSPSM